MERLNNKDVLALLEFIKDCYSIRDVDIFKQRVLSRVANLVQLKDRRYHEVGPPATAKVGTIQAHRGSSLSERDSVAYRVKLPFIEKPGNQKSLHNQLRPAGLYRFSGLGHRRAPLANLQAMLSSRTKHFARHDRAVLTLLRPHVLQAYRNAEMATWTERNVSLVERALSTLQLGLVILSLDGGIRFATRHAIEQLRNFFGDKALRRNRLPETILTWIKQQQLASNGKNTFHPRAGPLVLQQRGSRLEIRFVDDSGQTLLLLEEQPMTTKSQPGLPSSLSQRETQVLEWVSQGKTNKEIALILQLSARTIQKHLEHIYQKMGVENRTSATARAYELRR